MPHDSTTLYQRLGGKPALTGVVEDLYRRTLTDPLVAPFFAGVDMERMKLHQHAFLAALTGGVPGHNGVREAHSHLRIERRHFDAVAGHLVAALGGLSVPEETASEVLAAVAALAKEIVHDSAQSDS